MSQTEQVKSLGDIKPQTPISKLDRESFGSGVGVFPIGLVAPLVGMSETFIRKVVGTNKQLSKLDLLELLDQDSFSETVVPRSQVLPYLERKISGESIGVDLVHETEKSKLLKGNAIDVIRSLPTASVQTVVTSTPYWGMRIYKDSYVSTWADGEKSAFGHEQTPEGFIRHSCEVLLELYRVLDDGGSIWWNIMDTFNTRTQIRENAKQALEAMQGNDNRSWGDYESRRYSAGHSFLKDGEQSLIPMRIAERAARMGFYVKGIITWAKPSTLPEPQNSRVSRSLEYVIHLTKDRTPLFNKDAYRDLPADMGGRNVKYETDKLSDVWHLPTSAGRDGHGAQFPLALPSRCIALTSNENDVVFDPFVGSGNAGVAALKLNRQFIGSDVSSEYLKLASDRINPHLVENRII